MAARPLRTVQAKPLLTGTPAYEAQRAALIDANFAHVPDELRLPDDLLAHPPRNVTDVVRSCGLLTDDELDITENYDAVALARAIAERRLSAVQVADAFCKRAIIAHQLTCCLTQWFPDEARETAAALDNYQARTGTTLGPLHGVPISLKEHMPIAGHSSSSGMLATLQHDHHDCHMVRLLRAQGAVFYAKTNQPQAIMHLESDSFHGRTLNPYNIHLSAGGSTGGEAALIAMRGSVLGVGTDIGGSIRGPAAFCGLYGFKPTSNTLPMAGYLPGTPASDLNILASTGPLCASLRDMDLFMHAVLDQQPWRDDPEIVPIPWTGLRTLGLNRRLRVGIMLNDGVVQPQPPVAAALAWARLRLERSPACTVTPFEMANSAEGMALIHQLYWPEGGSSILPLLEAAGEPVLPLTADSLARGPQAVLDAHGLAHQRDARDRFRRDFATHWNAQDVDVVLAPAFVGPASMHDTATHWHYTALWNLLDYPGATIPTPAVASPEQRYASETPLSDVDVDVRRLWADGDFAGAPVALQIVARRHHDNHLFAALHALRDALALDGAPDTLQ